MVEVPLPFGRSSRCDRCGADLRCCRSCRFHDPSAWNECAEPSAERVLEKDRANFCDWFSPRVAGSAADPPASGGGAISDLERLFRKG